MNEKKFWKIIYLYITKYNYDIIYYRPEKKDVWLINDDNELIRFIYSDSFRNIEVDSVVSNIIKNEQRLKKIFRLNSLKIKVIYIANKFDEITKEYKKYKSSSSLIIERLLFSEKNRGSLIKEKDYSFIMNTPDTSRYKDRVVEFYKKQEEKPLVFDIKFNILSLVYILLFAINFLVGYFTQSRLSLFNYLDYNYQAIISGQFYRLFSSAFVVNDLKILLVLVATIFGCSLIFNKMLNIKHMLIVYLSSSFLISLIAAIGSLNDVNIASISFFSILGSILMINLNYKDNGTMMLLCSAAFPIVYLGIISILESTNLALYMLFFIIGLFLQIFLFKKRHTIVATGYIVVVILIGAIISAVNFDLKTKVNNYRFSGVEKRLANVKSDTDLYNLEQDLTTNNKSILTYYELGMSKMITSSIDDAKKVFLEGVKFDDSFAPVYYQLALIERKQSNYSTAKTYATKAYSLSNQEKYKNLKDELEKY